MFGERYFTLRNELGTLVHDTQGLARRAGVDLGDFTGESDLVQELRSPFLLMVCGEVNAGKSSFVNALFGKELGSVNVLPETRKVVRYRYGKEERTEESSEIQEERYQHLDFLKDFNIVDTPGTNSFSRAHEEVIGSLCPVADLVFLVFPVGNPWEASTWSLLSRFPEELKGKVAFVLQQSDQREEGELAIIREHMCSLARQKLGGSPEVFVVSAKMAWEARARQPSEDEERAWQASGYPALGQFISRRISESPARRQVACEVHDAASTVLRRIEDQLADTAVELDRKGRVLRELEDGMDCDRKISGAELEEKLVDLGAVLRQEGERVLPLLRRRVSLWPSLLSLFRRDESPAAFEKALGDRVEEVVRRLADEQAGELRQLCEEHWNWGSSRIREEIEVEPPATDGGEVDGRGAHQRFVLRMARAARRAVEKAKVRGVLEARFEARRRVLQRFLVGILMGVIAGGVLGAAGGHPFSWIFLGAALLVAVLGAWQARRSGRAVVESCRERVACSEGGFAELLGEEYRAGAGGYFKDYRVLYEIVRRVILQSDTVVKSRGEDCAKIRQSLSEIGRHL